MWLRGCTYFAGFVSEKSEPPLGLRMQAIHQTSYVHIAADRCEYSAVCVIFEVRPHFDEYRVRSSPLAGVVKSCDRIELVGLNKDSGSFSLAPCSDIFEVGVVRSCLRCRIEQIQIQII